MRISDWSSDVCSSDLHGADDRHQRAGAVGRCYPGLCFRPVDFVVYQRRGQPSLIPFQFKRLYQGVKFMDAQAATLIGAGLAAIGAGLRSEEHTSELQSLMRTSYAVFCLNKKKHNRTQA